MWIFINVISLFCFSLFYGTAAELTFGESCALGGDTCAGDLVCTNDKCVCSDTHFFIGTNRCANKIYEGGLCSSGNNNMCFGNLECIDFFCRCPVGKISDGNNNCVDVTTSPVSSSDMSSTASSSLVVSTASSAASPSPSISMTTTIVELSTLPTNTTVLTPSTAKPQAPSSSSAPVTVTPSNVTSGGITATPDNTVSPKPVSPSSPATTLTPAHCAFNPCFNGGECYVDADHYWCTCPVDYTGVVCENVAQTTTTVAPGPCATSLNPCFNGGTCVPEGDWYRCNCGANHTGLVCEQELTTLPPATTEEPSNCTGLTFDKDNFGCQPAEVVFMIEYGRTDSTGSVDHEGDFICKFISRWRVDNKHIRVGLIVYHNRVHEVIKIDDERSKDDLKGRISYITHLLKPSGDVNLTLALDYVRDHSFVNARPGVPRVVIPIIHQMPSEGLDEIPLAGDRLKSDCTSIYAFAVQGRDLNITTVQQTVSQPWENNLNVYSSFDKLEEAAEDGLYHNLHCH